MNLVTKHPYLAEGTAGTVGVSWIVILKPEFSFCKERDQKLDDRVANSATGAPIHPSPCCDLFLPHLLSSTLQTPSGVPVARISGSSTSLCFCQNTALLPHWRPAGSSHTWLFRLILLLSLPSLIMLFSSHRTPVLAGYHQSQHKTQTDTNNKRWLIVQLVCLVTHYLLVVILVQVSAIFSYSL